MASAAIVRYAGGARHDAGRAIRVAHGATRDARGATRVACGAVIGARIDDAGSDEAGGDSADDAGRSVVVPLREATGGDDFDWTSYA